MALTANTELVIQGVGSANLIGTDGTKTPIGKLQDMSVEISTTMEKVYGGDSIFNFFEFVKEKSMTFTFTSAVFNMNLLKLSQGSTSSAGELYKDEVITVDGTAKTGVLAITTGVTPADIIVSKSSDGTVFKYMTGTVPVAGFFTFDAATSTLKFAAADITGNTDFDVSYAYTKAGLVSEDILTTSVPGFVELRHTSNPTLMPDGNTYILHTRVYKARCDGKLNVNHKRGAAESPKLTFSSLDPQRADKKFCSFTMEQV